VGAAAVNEIIQRLLADLGWRLSAAGGRYKPSRQEVATWGGTQLNWGLKLLGGCGVQLISLVLFMATYKFVMAIAILFFLLMFLGLPLAFIFGGPIQRGLDMAAYRKRLERNERFTLIEYSRLLSRQIEMAQYDPTLGGPQEVARLRSLQDRIVQLIQSGASLDGTDQSSALSAEAQLAEAVLESYNMDEDQELQALDARLPAELRSKLEDLDREAQNKPQRAKE
jgi:hypothetical protein